MNAATASRGSHFPGGKVETVEQAAVRETDEETGHRVRAVCVLGRRIHLPPPGARIAYVATEFVARLASVSRDREEGNEEVVAYWRPAPEALRLLGPTLFEPVRRYLEVLTAVRLGHPDPRPWKRA